MGRQKCTCIIYIYIYINYMEMSAISREGKRTSGEANLCQNIAYV